MKGTTAAHGFDRQRSLRRTTVPSPGWRRLGLCLPDGFGIGRHIVVLGKQPVDGFAGVARRTERWDAIEPALTPEGADLGRRGEAQQLHDFGVGQDGGHAAASRSITAISARPMCSVYAGGIALNRSPV